MALTKVSNSMANSQAISALDYGAVGDGSTDDTAAIQAMFTAVGTGATVVFPPNHEYVISSTVTIPDPHGVTVFAQGANFKLTADTLMFDLNGRADPTYTDNESRQFFRWEGGKFGCTVASPTKATAFRMLGFRQAFLYPEEFGLYVDGPFYRDIITGGKDTIYIGNYKTRRPWASIEIPPWSKTGGPLQMTFENIHSSISGGDYRLLRSWMPLTDCVLKNFSCNMGTNAAQTAVLVERVVSLGVPSISGTFQNGETITGSVSGATATFRQVYVHDFPFQISQNMNWIVATTRSGTFQINETITGGTSGATATIGNSSGYLGQDDDFTNFSIEGPAHFEAGSAANGATCIKIADNEKAGVGSIVLNISGVTFGANGGGAIGLDLENMSRVHLFGCRFNQTSGNGTPIKLDSDCNNITIGRGTFFGSAPIDLNGMDRSELNLSAFDVTFSDPKVVTNFNPKSLSTTGDTIIDMSADFNQFATVAGLPPRSYGLTITAQDSGSAAAANARFRIHNPDETNANLFSLLDIRGVPDDQKRCGYFLVGADDNGDLEYDAVASGAGTLDVFMTVTEMKY